MRLLVVLVVANVGCSVALVAKMTVQAAMDSMESLLMQKTLLPAFDDWAASQVHHLSPSDAAQSPRVSPAYKRVPHNICHIFQHTHPPSE